MAIKNSEHILNLISLLEGALNYSNKNLVKYESRILRIIINCLNNEEITVLERAADLIHTVIISLSYAVPTDMQIFDPLSTHYDTPEQKYFYLNEIKFSNY
jgi:hypothetical protein